MATLENGQNLLQYNFCKMQNNKKPFLKFSAALGPVELLLFARVLFLSFAELIDLDFNLLAPEFHIQILAHPICKM